MTVGSDAIGVPVPFGLVGSIMPGLPYCVPIRQVVITSQQSAILSMVKMHTCQGHPGYYVGHCVSPNLQISFP